MGLMPSNLSSSKPFSTALACRSHCAFNKAQRLISSIHMGLDLQAKQNSRFKVTCLTKDKEACLPFLYFLNDSLVSLDQFLDTNLQSAELERKEFTHEEKIICG
jgi:hypothetical protein